MNPVAIYCRVSTDKQELAQQVEACRNFCAYRKFEVGQTYSDIMSGTKAARPQYQAMLKDFRAGLFSSLVVFRLDRLGRNSRELIMLVDELERRGVQLYSLNENLDTSTPIGKAVRDILLILAQLERDQIAEATRQRLTALKNLGKKLGRKEEPIDNAKLAELLKQGASIRQIARALKVSVGKAHTLKRGVQEKAPAKPMNAQPQSPLTVQQSGINEHEAKP